MYVYIYIFSVVVSQEIFLHMVLSNTNNFLTDTITRGQSASWSNSNEGVLPQSPDLQNWSLTIRCSLVSCIGNPIWLAGGSYSQHIQSPADSLKKERKKKKKRNKRERTKEKKKEERNRNKEKEGNGISNNKEKTNNQKKKKKEKRKKQRQERKNK